MKSKVCKVKQYPGMDGGAMGMKMPPTEMTKMGEKRDLTSKSKARQSSSKVKQYGGGM